MKNFKNFLTESSLSRLHLRYKDCDSGTISAFRGYRTYKQNMEQHKKLVGKLLGAGFSVTKIQGTYIENYKTPYAKEVNELSLIVFDHKKSGKLKNALIKLGKEFEQDSITYCFNGNGDYYCIGLCDKNKVKGEDGKLKMVDSWPGNGVEIKFGKPMFGGNGEFYSKINGRPFIFKEEFDAECFDLKASRDNFQINTIRCMRMMAKETLSEEELCDI